MVATGRYRFGSDTGQLLLRTFRTGLGSRAGHDLVIEVTAWRGTAQVAEPTAAASAQLTVEVGSFEVREGRGGLKSLTDGDRADIQKTIREKILGTSSHPRIEFRSTEVRGSAADLSCDGDLTIRAVTHGVTIQGSVEESSAGPRVRGHAQVKQTDWGIKPYSAFFGALRLRDEVDIDIDAALVSDG